MHGDTFDSYIRSERHNMNPDCRCELAGYCERHRFRKATRLIELCKQRGAYWDAWEANRGPGQHDPAQRTEPTLTVTYNHWCSLHDYAPKHAANWNPQRAKRWYAGWVALIPNSRGCGCREHWIAMQVEFDFSTPAAFFESAWSGHNLVSLSLHKPLITLSEAYHIWWKSGN